MAVFHFPSGHDNESGASQPPSVFCYVTDMSNETGYHVIPKAGSQESVSKHMNVGQPFVVTSVSNEWQATRLWSHAHFQQIFSGHDLFSSTFSTTQSPQFDDNYPNEAVYYGIFLNSHSLALEVARDYEYPSFIPQKLRLQGKLLGSAIG